MAAAAKRKPSFAGRVLIAVGLIVAVLLCLTLVYFTFDILMLVFAAVLLAIFLRGLAEVLRRWVPIGEGWLVLIVSVLLLGLIAGAIALLAPSVAEQVRLLRAEIPRAANSAAEYLTQFSLGQALVQQMPTVDEAMTKLDPATVLSRVGGAFSSTVGAVGNVLIVILLSIYLASEPRFYSEGIVRLFPINRRDRARKVMEAVYNTLSWWLIGKAGSMLFIGVLTWVGLSILGVPLALTLGLLAGLLSFIPNFGPIISAIPALLVAFIVSPMTALYVLILYVGIQIVESNIVTPLIERETVELPPALTIVFQLALGVTIGGLGLVLATPLLAVLVVVVQMVYIEDVLGDTATIQAVRQAEEAGETDASDTRAPARKK